MRRLFGSLRTKRKVHAKHCSACTFYYYIIYLLCVGIDKLILDFFLLRSEVDLLDFVVLCGEGDGSFVGGRSSVDDEAGLHTVAEPDNMLELILYLVIEAGYGANAESDNDEVAGLQL